MNIVVQMYFSCFSLAYAGRDWSTLPLSGIASASTTVPHSNVLIEKWRFALLAQHFWCNIYLHGCGKHVTPLFFESRLFIGTGVSF